MGYIYIIKNKINDKVYIGKTNLSIEIDLNNIQRSAGNHDVKKDHYMLPC